MKDEGMDRRSGQKGHDKPQRGLWVLSQGPSYVKYCMSTCTLRKIILAALWRTDRRKWKEAFSSRRKQQWKEDRNQCSGTNQEATALHQVKDNGVPSGSVPSKQLTLMGHIPKPTPHEDQMKEIIAF